MPVNSENITMEDLLSKFVELQSEIENKTLDLEAFVEIAQNYAETADEKLAAYFEMLKEKIRGLRQVVITQEN